MHTHPLHPNCRLVKELSSYKTEADEQQLRVQSMEAAGEDEYEVRQAVSNPPCPSCPTLPHPATPPHPPPAAHRPRVADVLPASRRNGSRLTLRR